MRTLQQQHFLLLHGPLSMPFLRWKTLTEPTTRPVRLTCWRHVLSLQHRLLPLPGSLYAIPLKIMGGIMI
ncbi:hypothetical protein ED724_05960 [Escherichia coli]|nr:hypothetical protein [Escherichia coli]EFN8704989.1 hypothetical protein [Escherichia coli O79]EEW2660102.1 hypothetical protein [Escherichia coli]EEW2816248.1 hypothetical protein [Escherichia coli]EEX8193370.1 hypothetical protein [Escherichia coli]